MTPPDTFELDGYSISPFTNHEGKLNYWIVWPSGEAMGVSPEKLKGYFDRIYKEEF